MKLLIEVSITVSSLPFQRVALVGLVGFVCARDKLAPLQHVFNLTLWFNLGLFGDVCFPFLLSLMSREWQMSCVKLATSWDGRCRRRSKLRLFQWLSKVSSVLLWSWTAYCSRSSVWMNFAEWEGSGMSVSQLLHCWGSLSGSSFHIHSVSFPGGAWNTSLSYNPACSHKLSNGYKHCSLNVHSCCVVLTLCVK